MVHTLLEAEQGPHAPGQSAVRMRPMFALGTGGGVGRGGGAGQLAQRVAGCLQFCDPVLGIGERGVAPGTRHRRGPGGRPSRAGPPHPRRGWPVSGAAGRPAFLCHDQCPTRGSRPGGGGRPLRRTRRPGAHRTGCPRTSSPWTTPAGSRAAYQFSATATEHVVQIAGGPTVWSMCAIDALGRPPAAINKLKNHRTADARYVKRGYVCRVARCAGRM